MTKTKIYIDAANLHAASRYFDKNIDYKRLFVWLKDKFKTTDIYYFIGYVKENEDLYTKLEAYGYKLIFKKTLRSQGKIKGNCDAELVLTATKDVIESDIDELVLVSSDGDFACLLEFATERGKKVKVISPSKRLSYLIRKMNLDIVWLYELIDKIAQKEKAPGKD